MLETLIQDLKRELQSEEMATPNEAGHYQLHFEDEITLDVWQTPQSYLLRSTVCACPPQNREAFLIRLLEGNLFGRGTRDIILGLNEEGTTLIASAELDLNTSYKDFRDKLENFVSIIDFWRKEALQHQ